MSTFATRKRKHQSAFGQGPDPEASRADAPDIARLPGARLVRASEPKHGERFDESMLKSMTGGEPMLVRHLQKGFFEFRPVFKLALSGNHRPEIGGVDHGIWRRMADRSLTRATVLTDNCIQFTNPGAEGSAVH